MGLSKIEPKNVARKPLQRESKRSMLNFDVRHFIKTFVGLQTSKIKTALPFVYTFLDDITKTSFTADTNANVGVRNQAV